MATRSSVCPAGPRGAWVALDKHTGKTVWVNTEIEHTAAYCSPLVVTYQGVRQLLTMTQKSVVGVDVATGNLVWSAPFVPRSPQNALTPVFHNGYVFVACGHSSGGTVLKIDPPSRGAQRGLVSQRPRQLPRRGDPDRRQTLRLRLPAGGQELLLRGLSYGRD